MREEERTRRERGEYARRRQVTKGPSKETPTRRRTHHRASRVAPFLLSTTRKNARRSILIVPDTSVDATTPALARFYRRVHSTARRSRHLSPPTRQALPLVVFPSSERAPTQSKKRSAAPERPSPAGTSTFSRAFVKRPRKRSRARTRAERRERDAERKRERESHFTRVPFFR